VIADERVKAVSSGRTCRARRCEQAGKHIKKAVMELGGSDPFIVLPQRGSGRRRSDRDHRTQPQQRPVCIAAKRFIVHARDVRRI